MRPSSPTSAAAERTSSGQPAMRWLTSVSETTTSQPSKSVSSCSGGPALPATFVPTSGKSSTSSFSASSRIDDGRQRVVVDQHELGGVDARRAVVARSRPRRCRRRSGRRPSRRPGAACAARSAGIGGGAIGGDVDVGAREHLDARELRRGRRVDARDLRVRERRADERERCARPRAAGSRRTSPRRGGSGRLPCAERGFRGCSRLPSLSGLSRRDNAVPPCSPRLRGQLARLRRHRCRAHDLLHGLDDPRLVRQQVLLHRLASTGTSRRAPSRA